MYSISSLASADFHSASNEPGCGPSPSARSTPTAEPFSPSTGQMSLFTETLEPWMLRGLLPTPQTMDAIEMTRPVTWRGMSPRIVSNQGIEGQAGLRDVAASISSAAGSHVNLSVPPGSAEARKMTVISGRKWLALSPRSDPLGSLARMFLGSSAWGSMACYLTWKTWATPSGRWFFRLAPSAPRTGGIASGLWPTPRNCGAMGANITVKAIKKAPQRFPNLETRVAMVEKRSGSLNPTWVEWLQGFPLGWTEVD